MLTELFKNLASYYYLENDLSNIAVALCNSDNHFRDKFITFFFPDINPDDIESIKREVPDTNGKGSRVDIFITLKNDTSPYLIEVKIGDRNHHFGQYEDAYGIDRKRLGYITNYYCHEGLEQGYDVKTWEDFYDSLIESESDELSLGFAAYIKSVCKIIRYKTPMRFENLHSLTQFMKIAKDIVCKNGFPNTRQFCYPNSMFEWFGIKDSGDKDGYVAAHLGIWFDNDVAITFGISNNQEFSNKLLANKHIFDTATYCGHPYADPNWNKTDVWIELKDDWMTKLSQAADPEVQRNILQSFFIEAKSLILSI